MSDEEEAEDDTEEESEQNGKQHFSLGAVCSKKTLGALKKQRTKKQMLHEISSEYFLLEVKVVRAADLAAEDRCGTSDPYVKIDIAPPAVDSNWARALHAASATLSTAPHLSHTERKTSVKYRTLDPEWNEAFEIRIDTAQQTRKNF